MLGSVINIDIDVLQAPLSEELPSGEDLRLDSSPHSAYFGLKDVRNQARAAERKLMVDCEPLLNLANEWDPIIEQVPKLLLTSSRDLEFCAWLIEALIRRNGFRGLGEGFHLAKLMIDSQWDSLFPEPDEDGLETRVAPLIGLNGAEGEGTLILPIACVPLTEEIEEQAYSLWEYEQALEVERLDEGKKSARHANGAIKLEDITRTVKATSPQFFNQLLGDITFASDAYKSLSQQIDSAVGIGQPSSKIIQKLDACANAVRFLAGDKLDMAASVDLGSNLDAASEPEQFNEAETEQTTLSTVLSNRAQAIAQLQTIAEFFKKTEPHSPMAYGIEQVVRWSEMTLPDLLQELISDNDARAGFFRLAGIKSEK